MTQVRIVVIANASGLGVKAMRSMIISKPVVIMGMTVL
jgi:hypothetical protein